GIARLSWFGHQSRLLPPSLGWAMRPAWTGHPPALSTFNSPTSALGLSGTGILPGIRMGCGVAGRAQAPVDDLGLVDDEAVVVGRGETGRVADGAVDIGDGSARTAHDVVVVVPHAGLVARHRAGWLDAPHQAGDGQRVQHVVDGLVGDLTEVRADRADDRRGVGVR